MNISPREKERRCDAKSDGPVPGVSGPAGGWVAGAAAGALVRAAGVLDPAETGVRAMVAGMEGQMTNDGMEPVAIKIAAVIKDREDSTGVSGISYTFMLGLSLALNYPEWAEAVMEEVLEKAPSKVQRSQFMDLAETYVRTYPVTRYL